MAALPTMLEPMRVSSGATCSKRDDRIVALSLLEQARAGLLATIVAREAKPANMVRLRFTQFMDGTSNRIDRQRVKIDSSSDITVSFKAVRNAADFVKYGFLIEADDGRQFLGPDAETLMDDGFRDGYCFELRRHDRDRPSQVGLRFVPATSKKGRIDVDGTLWIDTVARALKDIRFDYVGLPAAQSRANSGGRIEFRELANGIVFIDRWALRLPSVRQDTLWDGQTPTLREKLIAEQTGGEVAAAYWSDGTTWRDSLGTLRVHMLDAGVKPAVGRTIRLEGTDYAGASDSLGTVTLDRLLPGPYEAIIEDPTLEPIGVPLRTSLTFTATRGGTVETTTRAPDARDQVGKMCLDATTNAVLVPEQPWFVVRILEPDGKPFGHADWRAAKAVETGWSELNKASGWTSSKGLLQYCGGDVRIHDLIRLDLRASKSDRWVSVQFDMNKPITVVTLQIPARDQ